MYKRYILKLLFYRFSAILSCFIIFGLFQEIAKGEILKFCSINQLFEIIYLLIPFIVFQFLPFVYFITLFIVITELYFNNEILFLKTSGLSNLLIIKIFFHFAFFILLFSFVISFIYPYSNSKFNQKKNIFAVNNLLKKNKPNQINKIGKYDFFFTKIDNNNILHDATIFFKKKNIILYGDEVFFEYDNNNKLLIKCKNINLFTDNNIKNNQKYVAKIDYMEVFFNDFFDDDNLHNKQTYKQTIRQMDIKKLFLEAPTTKQQQILKDVEINNRIFLYLFLILTITAICCLLTKKSSNKTVSARTNLFLFFIGIYLSTSHSVLLSFSIKHNILLFYYSHFILILVSSIIYLTYNEILFNIKNKFKK